MKSGISITTTWFTSFPQHLSQALLRNTHRFHNGGYSPLCTEQPVAVQLPALVYVSVQDIDSDHAGVHRVWVLLHGSCRYCFPGVTAKTKPRHEVVHLQFF